MSQQAGSSSSPVEASSFIGTELEQRFGEAAKDLQG